MAHQSLYRRYRSQKFGEILGQDHVTGALRNAVAEGRHGHAYLFSGPRGTGKTSTARVLAKALNCENLDAGEPCGECQSCVDIEHGKSFDLHELDAASNNKVDDVRDLIAKVALGSPGRTKVYILDEVHMLSAGAENALLKTLEEPPPHVVFVLATTEPHKVVETIRSRTQHYEFKLLPSSVLEAHLRFVIEDAGLDVGDDGIEYAIAQGGGSARDTLSALDLVAATGGVPEGTDVGRELAMSIGAGDAAATIAAVQAAIMAGREPRTIGEATLRGLRNAFLVAMGAPLTQLSEAVQLEAETVAKALGAATITRSLEVLGQALVEMRQAPDPRVPLEVALLRLARREGNDMSALLQRIEALESQVASLSESGGAAPAVPPSTAPPSTAPPAAALPATPSAGAGPPAAAAPRRAPAPAPPAPSAVQPTSQPPAPAPTPQPPAPSPPSTEPVAPAASAADPTAPDPAAAGPITLERLNQAFDTDLLDGLEQKVRTRFKSGRFLSVADGRATFGVPNAHYVSRVQEVTGDVEGAIQRALGGTLKIEVVVDESSVPPPRGGPPASQSSTPPPSPSDEAADVGAIEELDDASDIAGSSVDRLTQAFPGAQVVPPPNS